MDPDELDRNEENRIQVGDWVRFHSNGVLVIGQVEYIKDGSRHYPFERVIVTTAGERNEGDILEARSSAGVRDLPNEEA